MTSSPVLAGLCVVFFATTAIGVANRRAEAAPAERPNIVIFMLDDMGYSDLGCYGSQIETPNIDRLAAGGLRFTRFYNAARCCPTRAALMTGLYPHQVGLARNGRSLTRDGVTIAEVLGETGYQTAMAGKWHLSRTYTLEPVERHMRWVNHLIHPPDQPFGPRETYPVRRGFEKFHGIIWGVVDYFDPFSLVEGMQPVERVPEDYYITDAINEHAVQYIREADRECPLFLYVAHCAPHWPLHAREEDIAKYEGRFTGGWHVMRERRYRKQIETGLIDPETHSLPKLMGRGKDWDRLSEKEKALQTAKMQVHAAMIDRADQGVDDIVAALKETGRYENTAIFVLSDNGASPEVPGGPGYDRSGRTRNGEKIRYGGFSPEELGSETTYTGIGSWWANAANTPFRYWKKESFEGGAHTPLIVHWPQGLETEPGSTTDSVGHVMDLMPTCLDLAGAEYPQRHAGHRIEPLEGKSLLPILRGKRRDGHEKLLFEHVGGKAVIRSGWKAVQPTNGTTWELYHLAEDRCETNDLAGRYPERLRSLVADWKQWARRMNFLDESTNAAAKTESPSIANRPLTITGHVESEDDTGVIVAQGGKQQGYAVHLLNDKLAFDVRIDGQVARIVSEEAVPQNFDFVAKLTADSFTLSIDGEKVAEAASPGLIPVQPIDAMNVGRDERTAAGDYVSPNPLRGTISSLNVKPGSVSK